MHEFEAIIDNCINCKLCIKNCAFLEQFCDDPIDFAKSFSVGLDEDEAFLPYLCTLCGLCEVVCPKDLSFGKMCMEAREDLVKQGIGPLSFHDPVVEEQKHTMTDDFILEFSDPNTGTNDRVFMPGCHLTEYSPDLVVSSYEWLTDAYPNTGFMFRCCAAPTRTMGVTDEFNEMGKELIVAAKKMGAKEIIVACPNCRKTVDSFAEDIKVTSLYELMAESGKIQKAKNSDHVFAIHDPCADRYNSVMQDAVRTLLDQLGFTKEEFKNHGKKTTCCGMGGMVGYVSMDMPEAVKMSKLAQTDSDVVTYCASCRETFSDQRDTIHLLDLVFREDWERAKSKEANKMSVKHDNLVFLRRKLVEKYQLTL